MTRTSRFGLPHFEWSLELLGLCVFTFTIVTYRLPIADVGVAIAALGLALHFGKIRAPFPVWLFGAFMFWAFLASFASPFPSTVQDNLIERLKLLAIILIVVNALRTEGQLRFYLLFFLGCYALFPVRGTLVGGDTVFGRAVWNYIYNNPNELAALSLIALGVALGITFSTTGRSIIRYGAGIVALLLVLVILLTQSRAAFIGLVIGMGPPLVWSGMKRPGRLLLSAGLVALVIVFAVPASVWERIAGIGELTSTSTIAQADPEGSAAERFEIQKVAWRILGDHPVFGVGLGAYPEAHRAYDPGLGPRDTHNTYLNIAAEVGLPGFAIWCAFVFSVMRYAYRCRQLAPTSELAIQQAWIERAIVAYLVSGMFGSFGRLTFPYLLLAVLWCSATLLAAASQNSIDPNGTTRA